MNQAESRRAIRAAISRRRLLDLLVLATESTLDAGECPACEIEAVTIQFILRRSKGEFRTRRIRVLPEYGPRPLTTLDNGP